MVGTIMVCVWGMGVDGETWAEKLWAVFIGKSAHLDLIINSAQIPAAGWHIPIDITNKTSSGLNPEVIS